jgi:hypothetical protein
MSYFTESAIIPEPISNSDQLRTMIKQIAHLAISSKNASLTAQDGMTRTEHMTRQLAGITALLLLTISLNIEDADTITLARKIIQ